MAALFIFGWEEIIWVVGWLESIHVFEIKLFSLLGRVSFAPSSTLRKSFGQVG